MKSFNELRSEAKAMGINTKGMSKEAIENAIARTTETAVIEETVSDEPQVIEIINTNEDAFLEALDKVIVEQKRLGRPVEPDSVRQQRLKEMNAKREAGELKRGRPVDPTSPRQQRLAMWAAKREAGELRRGRPKMEKVEAPVVSDGEGI